jgi:hypothetical protein
MHESIQTETRAAEPKWGIADDRASEIAGWNLVATPNGVEIQCDLDMDFFASDNEAIVHVLRRAKLREGVLERNALVYLARVNPEYYQDVVIDIERRMGLS